MKNKKLIALAIAGVLGIGAIAGGTLAYFTDSDNKTNVITMGHVDVDLEEPGWENPNNVQPGNKYLKDPQISVVDGSEDAYLRAKVTVTLKDKNGNDVMVDGEQLLPALSEVVDINDGWNPTPDADGYYYYNTKVSAPTTVSLFKVKGEGENKYTVEIPMSWGNAYADTVLTIDIVAEGIQADNFTPQMDGTNIIGWNDVTAETYNK
ncbi:MULTISPECIES: TasA family protein [Bacillota]|jgi:predicted ribosomally synthesized peptide with SipW-like signal peptide|uniref:Camelysin metallo-endopeptidase n=2 Tax=Amedibacillus TaxID=2749846 RepID=A0A7G9GIS9_9FIRM|nr:MULTISPECIES: TasA family protein [Bacillota]QNM10711.1 hypothetical protein H9Q80_10435 [[Eubacterium] hominis]MCH4285676.1 CalY family protein [Amedibacillus hominis]RGB53982.1 hypothetical protein DW271_11110 [Absiella sp. AM22-9]RGB61259.1 hypothetical protein DW120_07410 [Absiella sp. AM10-20]RGB63118.1 hypothetical protein DW113_18385 [Absiella sp. AM09-45]